MFQFYDCKTGSNDLRSKKISTKVTSLLVSVLFASSANAGIINGGFEDGLTGWTTNVYGGANPVSLTSGTVNSDAGTINPSLTSDQYIYTSQSAGGLSILSQSFNVSAGINKLFFDVAINNGAGGYFTPDSFDYSGAATQQARFDVLKPGSDPTVYNASDVIATGFKTESGDPLSTDWTTKEIDLSADLVAYVGQDVILRFWQEDNQMYFNLALDNINVGQQQNVLNAYFDQTIAGKGNLPSQKNAQRLDNFVGAGMDTFKTFLDACTTDECVSASIDQLEIKLAGAGVGAAKQTAQAIAKIIRERQNIFIGENSGETMFTEKNFWFKPFGTWGEQKSKDYISGYDVDTYGFGIGLDGTNKNDQQFGASFFYNNSNVNVNNANQNADIDGFTVMGYGSMPIIDAKTKFLYQVSYSWQKTDTSRNTALGTAKADYVSKVGSIDLSFIRDYQVNNEWLLQPTVGATYTHYTTPSYSESGAGVAGSDVDKFTTSEFLFNIGTKANYKIDDSSKFITSLDLSYDMQDKNDIISATTQGGLQLEDTKSIDNGRFGFAIGLGYEKEITQNSNINFSYSYAGEGSRYSTNSISVKYMLTF